MICLACREYQRNIGMTPTTPFQERIESLTTHTSQVAKNVSGSLSNSLVEFHDVWNKLSMPIFLDQKYLWTLCEAIFYSKKVFTWIIMQRKRGSGQLRRGGFLVFLAAAVFSWSWQSQVLLFWYQNWLHHALHKRLHNNLVNMYWNPTELSLNSW